MIAYQRVGNQLRHQESLRLGFAPVGLALNRDATRAYVALSEGKAIVVVDLDPLRLVAKIEVGNWPRYLGLAPDGKRLAVGLSGDLCVAVIDTETQQVLFREKFAALNLGQMAVSPDGQSVYVPWIAYGSNPITAQNIRRGWVIASRLARVWLDRPARREALALDKRGEAVGDPFGMAQSPDQKWLAVSASGSHELLVFLQEGLPLQDYGGPGDTIDEELVNDSTRFFRVPLGGRPMAIRFARDSDRVFVANYLENKIQVVSISQRCVVQEIEVGCADSLSLARRGEAIFYDARRSLDQWYSCHSCHYEGSINALKMDTTNDGGFGTFKTVLDLHGVAETSPWTWHGWQNDFRATLAKSLTETMLGPPPSEDDISALTAYLDRLEMAPNPYRQADGTMTSAAKRGQKIFASEAAGCSQCHSGAHFTDGQIHDVGLGSEGDHYQGFNTPSLRGVHRRVRLLHDGRASSLEEVLRGDHAPERVRGEPLAEDTLADLIDYLRSL